MRIAFLQEAFWPEIGGIEIVTMLACQELARRGHEAFVITSKNTSQVADRELVDDTQVFRLPFRQALKERNMEAVLAARVSLSRILQEVRPDVLQLNLSGPIGYFLLSAPESKQIPWVLAVRHRISETSIEPGSLVGRLLDEADWITGNSTYSLREALAACPGARSRASTIYNGMSVPDAQPDVLLFDPPHFVFLGRLIPDKGAHRAIEAFDRVLRRYPGARLTVAGDGPSRGSLERQATQLTVPGSVRFTGWVAPNDVADLMNSATIALVPSREESFGMVALEAAIMGRPVIAYDVGGLPEVVSHERTGLVVPRDDLAELAIAMLRLIEDRDECVHMGAEGRVRALERFSLERYVDEYETLYASLVASVAGQRRAG